MSDDTAAPQTETVATQAAPEAVTPQEGESISSFAKRFVKTLPKDAQPESDAAVAESEVAASEGEAVDEKPTKPAPKVEDLQALAKDGKYAEVLEALGIEVDGTRIPADRFAKFRKMQKQERDKLVAREAKIASYENEVRSVVNQVAEQYKPFAEAKKAWDSGDVVGAITAAFGVKSDEITDLIARQALAQDPELIKLKRQLEAKEKREQEEQSRRQAETQEAEKTRAVTQYVASVKSSLEGSDDPQLAKIAGVKDFPLHVYRAQLHYWNTEQREVSVEDAAREVLKIWRKDFELVRPIFAASGATTVETDESGTETQSTDRAGKSPEKKRPTPKGVPLTRARSTPTVAVENLSDDERWKRLKADFLRQVTE